MAGEVNMCIFVIIWLNFTLNGSITISVRSLLAQRRRFICVHLLGNIPLCKHVVAKVTLVPCSVNVTGKREKRLSRGSDNKQCKDYSFQ